GGGARGRAAARAADDLGPVRPADQGDQVELVAGEAGVGGDRRLAAAAEDSEEATLGGDPAVGVLVVDGAADQAGDLGVVGAGLDAERALAGGRHAGVRIEQLGDAAGVAEAAQPGGRQHRGVDLAGVDLAHAGRQIAWRGEQFEVRPQRAALAGAAQVRRADAVAGRQRRQRDAAAADQRVARILALGGGRHGQAGGQLGRHVLHAVHREVGLAVEQRLLDLLDEQALAADLGQRAVDDAVAGGLDDEELDGEAGGGRDQAIADVVGLPEGELAAAGRDDESILHAFFLLSPAPEADAGAVSASAAGAAGGSVAAAGAAAGAAGTAASRSPVPSPALSANSRSVTSTSTSTSAWS